MGEVGFRHLGGGGGIKKLELGHMASGSQSNNYNVAFPAGWDWAYLAFQQGYFDPDANMFIGKVELKNTSGWFPVKIIKNKGDIRNFDICERRNPNYPTIREFDFQITLFSGQVITSYIYWSSLSFQL